VLFLFFNKVEFIANLFSREATIFHGGKIMDCTAWMQNKEIMSLYMDTAKSFINISSAALGLTVIFREKISGLSPGVYVNRFMIASWVCFLGAICCGVFYQYMAVNFLDFYSLEPGSIYFFNFFIKNPGYIYGAMLIFFILASILLVLAAWKQLPKRDSLDK